MSKPKFWVQEVRVSEQGLHCHFANELEAHRFYLHLQYQGATSAIDGTEVTIYKHRAGSD